MRRIANPLTSKEDGGSSPSWNSNIRNFTLEVKHDFIYDAIVVSIYDGDTIRADIDLGFSTWIKNASIRLLGIDAPELRGEERQDGLNSKEWLVSKLPIGCKIVLKTEKDSKEKYGRYLGIIYSNGTNLNEEMVSLGLAKVY